MLVSSLLSKHKATGQPDSVNIIRKAAGHKSASTTEPKATLLNSRELGQRHHQQSSQFAAQEPLVSSLSHVNGSLHNVTFRSVAQPDPAGSSAAALNTASREDLLIVMPSSIDRVPIVEASRGWRQGVHTYIAFEQQIDLNTAPTVFKVQVSSHSSFCSVCLPERSAYQQPCVTLRYFRQTLL